MAVFHVGILHHPVWVIFAIKNGSLYIIPYLTQLLDDGQTAV